MEPTDLTLRVLQEIRDSIREGNDRTEQRISALQRDMDARFETVDKRFDQVDKRFEVVETTLRDLAQQMVMLSRGIKTALESRAEVDSRLGSVEKRLDALENRQGH